MVSENEEIELENVKNEKDLGVIIDHNLTFRDHITSKVDTANRNLGIIFRFFTYIDEGMFLNLYKSLIRPHVEYATPFHHACKNLYTERLPKLGLPTLEYRRERADMIQTNKNFAWDRQC